MKIVTLPVGSIEANCYLIYDETSNEALIIDPGAQGQLIMNKVDELGLKVKYIVNTHGHGDHIGANQYVKDTTGAVLLVHEEDGPMLTDPGKNLSSMMGLSINKPTPDRLLQEGDSIQVGSLSFTFIHTPGHTPGGICMIGHGVCFSGDTLFDGSVGRSDFPGGSHDQLINSIKNKLLTLPMTTMVYPGHGNPTTIGREMKSNPFLD